MIYNILVKHVYLIYVLNPYQNNYLNMYLNMYLILVIMIKMIQMTEMKVTVNYTFNILMY